MAGGVEVFDRGTAAFPFDFLGLRGAPGAFRGVLGGEVGGVWRLEQATLATRPLRVRLEIDIFQWALKFLEVSGVGMVATRLWYRVDEQRQCLVSKESPDKETSIESLFSMPLLQLSDDIRERLGAHVECSLNKRVVAAPGFFMSGTWLCSMSDLGCEKVA